MTTTCTTTITPGRQLARAIEQAAADMINELDATKRLVDILEPTVSDIGVDAVQVVAELKQLGLDRSRTESAVRLLASTALVAGASTNGEPS